eukprot:GILI01008227.1.p1 GENE.GILI01008227.1~~GILI01008227.1.p1  ORF type:complete len:1227 (-),score=231.96 GILI01008227.1:2545-6225(-)
MPNRNVSLTNMDNALSFGSISPSGLLSPATSARPALKRAGDGPKVPTLKALVSVTNAALHWQRKNQLTLHAFRKGDGDAAHARRTTFAAEGDPRRPSQDNDNTSKALERNHTKMVLRLLQTLDKESEEAAAFLERSKATADMGGSKGNNSSLTILNTSQQPGNAMHPKESAQDIPGGNTKIETTLRGTEVGVEDIDAVINNLVFDDEVIAAQRQVAASNDRRLLRRRQFWANALRQLSRCAHRPSVLLSLLTLTLLNETLSKPNSKADTTSIWSTLTVDLAKDMTMSSSPSEKPDLDVFSPTSGAAHGPSTTLIDILQHWSERMLFVSAGDDPQLVNFIRNSVLKVTDPASSLAQQAALLGCGPKVAPNASYYSQWFAVKATVNVGAVAEAQADPFIQSTSLTGVWRGMESSGTPNSFELREHRRSIPVTTLLGASRSSRQKPISPRNKAQHTQHTEDSMGAMQRKAAAADAGLKRLVLHAISRSDSISDPAPSRDTGTLVKEFLGDPRGPNLVLLPFLALQGFTLEPKLTAILPSLVPNRPSSPFGSQPDKVPHTSPKRHVTTITSIPPCFLLVADDGGSIFIYRYANQEREQGGATTEDQSAEDMSGPDDPAAPRLVKEEKRVLLPLANPSPSPPMFELFLCFHTSQLPAMSVHRSLCGVETQLHQVASKPVQLVRCGDTNPNDNPLLGAKELVVPLKEVSLSTSGPSTTQPTAPAPHGASVLLLSVAAANAEDRLADMLPFCLEASAAIGRRLVKHFYDTADVAWGTQEDTILCPDEFGYVTCATPMGFSVSSEPQGKIRKREATDVLIARHVSATVAIGDSLGFVTTITLTTEESSLRTERRRKHRRANPNARKKDAAKPVTADISSQAFAKTLLQRSENKKSAQPLLIPSILDIVESRALTHLMLRPLRALTDAAASTTKSNQEGAPSDQNAADESLGAAASSILRLTWPYCGYSAMLRGRWLAHPTIDTARAALVDDRAADGASTILSKNIAAELQPFSVPIDLPDGAVALDQNQPSTNHSLSATPTSDAFKVVDSFSRHSTSSPSPLVAPFQFGSSPDTPPLLDGPSLTPDGLRRTAVVAQTSYLSEYLFTPRGGLLGTVIQTTRGEDSTLAAYDGIDVHNTPNIRSLSVNTGGISPQTQAINNAPSMPGANEGGYSVLTLKTPPGSAAIPTTHKLAAMPPYRRHPPAYSLPLSEKGVESIMLSARGMLLTTCRGQQLR